MFPMTARRDLYEQTTLYWAEKTIRGSIRYLGLKDPPPSAPKLEPLCFINMTSLLIQPLPYLKPKPFGASTLLHPS